MSCKFHLSHIQYLSWPQNIIPNHSIAGPSTAGKLSMTPQYPARIWGIPSLPRIYQQPWRHRRSLFFYGKNVGLKAMRHKIEVDRSLPDFQEDRLPPPPAPLLINPKSQSARQSET